MSEIIVASRPACPLCLRPPKVWKERKAYGSRELFWVACEKDPKMFVGAITQPVALQLWERRVLREKFELAHK